MHRFTAVTSPPYADLSDYLRPLVRSYLDEVEEELDGTARVLPMDHTFGLGQNVRIPDVLTTQGNVSFKRAGGFWESIIGDVTYLMEVTLQPLRPVLSKHGIITFRGPFSEAVPSPPSWDIFFRELSRETERCPVTFSMTFRGMNFRFDGTLRRGVTDHSGPTIGAGRAL